MTGIELKQQIQALCQQYMLENTGYKNNEDAYKDYQEKSDNLIMDDTAEAKEAELISKLDNAEDHQETVYFILENMEF